MFSLDQVSKVITMSRGDSIEFPLFINEGPVWAPIQYDLSEYDSIYLGIMEIGQCFEHAIVKKIFNCYSDKDEDGDLLIKLNPIDTMHLRPGKYYYTIKMRTIDPDTLDTKCVQTIVPDTLFYII